ncbi:unnamed protein product [Prunus armeniaca]
MTKPKVEEAKPNAEEKPDDLEINSIGSLYNGPWDKKYWSSSRVSKVLLHGGFIEPSSFKKTTTVFT